MKIAEVLRQNGAEVVVTERAEVLNFDGAHVSRALSADEMTGIIFMGGVEDRKGAALAEHHVIILSQEDIKENAIEAYRHAAAKSDCLFASSSPSKTADIEGKLIYGMHGPKKLTVVIEVKNERL
jgi:L-lactate dehydrogenase complex protein LldG